MSVTRAVNEGWDFPDGNHLITHKNKVSIAFTALYLANLDRRTYLVKLSISMRSPTSSPMIPVCHRAQESCAAFQTVTMPSEIITSKSPLKQTGKPRGPKDSEPTGRNAGVEDEGNTSKA